MIKSRLDNIGVVRCVLLSNKKECRTPNPHLLANIPTMWDMLKLTVQDWEREAAPLQKQIDSASSEGEELYFLTQAFINLQPYYLKCLFSYVMLFCSLESAYDLLYQQINKLNKNPCFQIQHDKKPKTNSYIKKVWDIRDISIAHVGDPKKNHSKIDSLAAMSWQPMTLSKQADSSWDVEKLSFGSGKHILKNESGSVLEESSDFEINGILEVHSHCMKYIDKYDQVCADYLGGIITTLPVIHNNVEYIAFGGDN
jgi:hypothetical protein